MNETCKTDYYALKSFQFDQFVDELKRISFSKVFDASPFKMFNGHIREPYMEHISASKLGSGRESCCYGFRK